MGEGGGFELKWGLGPDGIEQLISREAGKPVGKLPKKHYFCDEIIKNKWKLL